jgi:hypothetical protein
LQKAHRRGKTKIEGVKETQQTESGKNKHEEGNDIKAEKKYMRRKTKRWRRKRKD